MSKLRIAALICLPLVLTGCSQAPEKDFVGFETLTLTAEPTPDTQATETPKSEQFVNDPSAEISIDDQTGDGKSIKIHEIHVGRGNAFLVIYDEGGLVIAQAVVTPQSQPVTIYLDYQITQSQALQAALYLDDGDGLFQLDLDHPILGEEGKLVHEDFNYKVSN